MPGDEKAAAIDVGSNTVHMLVASWRDGDLAIADEASQLVGLAQDVYAGGRIAPDRLAEAADAVARLVERARGDGAGTILLVATAAVRDAANADDLVAAVRERTALDLQTIDGEREAQLTYRGASSGEEGGSLQVCDVGGGSTEIIRAEGGTVTLETSLPLGSSRLTRSDAADPPTDAQVAAAYDAAVRALTALPPFHPMRLIVTGGTATALATVGGSAAGTGTTRRYVMPATELESIRDRLRQEGSSEIATRYRVEPKRARLLPAGASIIAALRAAAGTDRVVLNAAGLRDGLLIDYFKRR